MTARIAAAKNKMANPVCRIPPKVPRAPQYRGYAVLRRTCGRNEHSQRGHTPDVEHSLLPHLLWTRHLQRELRVAGQALNTHRGNPPFGSPEGQGSEEELGPVRRNAWLRQTDLGEVLPVGCPNRTSMVALGRVRREESGRRTCRLLWGHSCSLEVVGPSKSPISLRRSCATASGSSKCSRAVR